MEFSSSAHDHSVHMGFQVKRKQCCAVLQLGAADRSLDTRRLYHHISRGRYLSTFDVELRCKVAFNLLQGIREIADHGKRAAGGFSNASITFSTKYISQLSNEKYKSVISQSATQAQGISRI